MVQATMESDKGQTVQKAQWGPKTQQDADKIRKLESMKQPVLVSTSRDQTAKVWDLRTGMCVATTRSSSSLPEDHEGNAKASQPAPPNRRNKFYCALPAHGGNAFITGSTDGVLRRWCIRTGVLKREDQGHGGGVSGIACHAESGRLVTASSGGTIRVWRPRVQCEFCPSMCALGEGCRARELRPERIVVPDAPNNISAVAIVGGTTVSWEAPLADGGASMVRYVISIRRCSEPGVVCEQVQVDSNATSCDVLGLCGGCDYKVDVAAMNGEGLGPAAVYAGIITPLSPPKAPRDVVCTNDFLSGAVHLSWTAVPDTDCGGSPVLDYVVDYAPEVSNLLSDGSSGRMHVGLVTECHVCSDAIICGEAYQFHVRAINEAGMSSASQPVTATPMPPKRLPGIPSCLAVSAAEGERDDNGTTTAWPEVSLRFVWSPPTDNGGSDIIAYQVQIRKTSAQMPGDPSLVEGVLWDFCQCIHVEQYQEGDPCLNLVHDHGSISSPDELYYGRGIPLQPELHVNVLSDPRHHYHLTVAAVTEVGMGVAESTWFPNRSMERSTRPSSDQSKKTASKPQSVVESRARPGSVRRKSSMSKVQSLPSLRGNDQNGRADLRAGGTPPKICATKTTDSLLRSTRGAPDPARSRATLHVHDLNSTASSTLPRIPVLRR